MIRVYAMWTWTLVVMQIIGCTSGVRPRGQMAGRDFDHDHEVIYPALKTVLAQRGYDIVEEDPDSGVIKTNWVEVGRDRTKAVAKISPVGQGWTRVQVEILHDSKGLTGGEWKPRDVSASIYRDLFQDLDTQAYREYFLKIERRDSAGD